MHLFAFCKDAVEYLLVLSTKFTILNEIDDGKEDSLANIEAHDFS